MHRLTHKDIKRICDQNYNNFLKLRKNVKKSERNRLKYKLYYETQRQLLFSTPRCYLDSFDDDDIKISDLHKIYREKKSSVKNKKIENDISSESLENTSSTSSGYSTLSSCSRNEILCSIKSTEENNESTAVADESTAVEVELKEAVNENRIVTDENRIIADESTAVADESTAVADESTAVADESTAVAEVNEEDDYNSIVNAVNAEVDIKNAGSVESKLNLQKNDEIPTGVRRTSRARQPVLYSEDLAHIKFIGSSKYSSKYNSNCKQSPASSKNSSGSRKNIKITNSTNVTPTHNRQISSTPTTSRNPNIFNENYSSENNFKVENINGTLVCTDHLNNCIQVKPLPKTAPGSILDIQIGNKVSNTIAIQPHRITVRIQQLHEEFNERQKIAVAVASITTNENVLNSIENPVEKRTKTGITRRSRNKRTKPFKEHKSELARYVETFGDGANITNNEQQQQQIPYQSPQNAGVSTTTCELGNVIISPIPNSNTVTLGEILSLENQSGFSIIKYMEGDGSTLPINFVPENNYQTSPGAITSTTDLKNQQTADKTIPSYDNNIFFHQITPVNPPQPVIKNYYQRALSENFQPSATDTNNFQIINSPLPSAHRSSTIYNNQIQFVGGDALNLSKHHHTLIDMDGRDTKEELIAIGTSNNDENPSKLGEDKKQCPPIEILNNDTIVLGRDMPLLGEDDNSGNNTEETSPLQLNELNEIELSLDPNINLKNNKNSKSSGKKSNKKRKFEIIDSQVLKKIPKKQENEDENSNVPNLDESYNENSSKDFNNGSIIKSLLNKAENIDGSETKEVLEKSEISNSDSTSNKIANDKSVHKVESPYNKSKEPKENISDYLDEYFVSMNDNDDLDYEQDEDFDDYLNINSSPIPTFDNDDEEITTTKQVPITDAINNNVLTDPRKPQALKKDIIINNVVLVDPPPKAQDIKKPVEKCDIFGIIRKSTPEKEDSSRPMIDFKIPKIDVNLKKDENTTCSSGKQIINRISMLDCNGENVQKCGKQIPNRSSMLDCNENILEKQPKLLYWPNNPTNIIKPPAAHEFQTRFSAPSTSSVSFSATSSSLESLKLSSSDRNRIPSVFGSPCFEYLKGNCLRQNCRFNHILPNEKIVKSVLDDYSDSYLEKVYKFTLRHLKLFQKYFCIFFQLYVEKRNNEMLRQIIFDSQNFKTCTDYLYIFRNKLIEFGWSKVDAVQFLITNWNVNSDIARNHIINMIVDANPLAFKSTLEHYSKIPNYRFDTETIIKLAAHCNKYKDYDLIELLICIIKNNIPIESLLQNTIHNNEEFQNFLKIVENLNKNTNNNNVLMICKRVGEPQIQRTVVQQNNLTNMLNEQISPTHINLFKNQM